MVFLAMVVYVVAFVTFSIFPRTREWIIYGGMLAVIILGILTSGTDPVFPIFE